MCEKESVKGKLEKLLSLAESAEEGFNWRIACDYYYEAVELSESNGYYYHKIGLLEQECGNYEKAYKAFLKSIELSPNENATNYLYIAQYCQGKDSENAYLKAIEILENELKKISKNDDNNKVACASNASKSELDDDDIKMRNDKNDDTNDNNDNSISKYKYSISNIYVSIGELYTTDLCDIENAEMIAQSYFEESIKWCDNNPESHCAFGEFRLLQCKKEEAKKEFELCVKYLINDNSGNDNSGNDNSGNSNELNNELKSELNENNEYNISKNDSITIDSLIKMIKLGIECESYDRTLILCDYILKIDENNGQAWGLGSLCFYNLNDKHECAIWLNNAKIILSELEDEFDKENLINVLNVVESNIDINGLPDIDNDDNNEENNEYESEEDKFDDNANSKRINYIVDEINEKLGRTYIAKRKEPDTDIGDTGDTGDMNEVESFLNDDDNDDDHDDNDDNDDNANQNNENNENNENDQMLDID